MPTGRSIDHVTLVVDHLDGAAERYQALGFTLTPRASHEDRMGTSNRLIQFEKENFIEILEVDRPQTVEDHAFHANPPRFSFGAHHRFFVTKRNGISMLAFTGDDARADIATFRKRGIQTYAPFDFERQAKLPDGSDVTVAFSLAFATSPNLPEIAFFVCQNRSSEYFWKPAYQRHRNGARSIVAVYLVADDPEAHSGFLRNLFGGAVTPTTAGIRVACGDHQEIVVLEPNGIEAVAPGTAVPVGCSPRVVGVGLESANAEACVTPTDQGYGMFIEWRTVTDRVS